MSETDQYRETQRWLSYATGDLAAAQAIAADRHLPPRVACSLSQQSAEKAMKAALVFVGVEFPKTHSLELLRNLLPADWRTGLAGVDLSTLSQWAVEARYPGDVPEATGEQGIEAVSQAGKVLQHIRDCLAQRGFR